VYDRGNVILTLGKAEAVLPRNEQIPSERYHHGQRLRTYVVEVQKSSRGPQILVSRTRREFLRRLFELEVPEVFSGTVEIKAIAREPGSRSKVAVAAIQTGIDPVGSCVGVRGVRIQNIVNELGGEKIDVVSWDPDAAAFVAHALSPAKVTKVYIDEETNTATVVVPDHQLSLAIGKEGQNARLAAKLTGWRIDIRNETEAAAEMERKAGEAAAAAAEQAKLEAARAEAVALLAEAESLIEQEESAQAEAVPEAEAMEPAEVEAEVEGESIEPEIAAEEAMVAEAPAPEELPVEEPAIAEAPASEELPVEEPVEELVLEELAEDSEDEIWEEEESQQTRQSREQQRSKRWSLVYDEESGQMIARRKRKPSRQRNRWQDIDVSDLDHLDDWDDA